MTHFQPSLRKVVLPTPYRRTRVTRDEIVFIVESICHTRMARYPVLMGDPKVVQMIERECADLTAGKLLTREQRIDVFESVISKAEKDPILALHRAYLQDGER